MEQKFSRALLFSMVRQSRGVRSQLPCHPELGVHRKQCQPSLSANSAFSSLIPEKVPQRTLSPSVRSLGFAEVSDLTPFRAGRASSRLCTLTPVILCGFSQSLLFFLFLLFCIQEQLAKCVVCPLTEFLHIHGFPPGSPGPLC